MQCISCLKEAVEAGYCEECFDDQFTECISEVVSAIEQKPDGKTRRLRALAMLRILADWPAKPSDDWSGAWPEELDC